MAYPDPKDPKFQDEIEKKFKQFRITKQPSFRELCYPQSFQLQKPQQFVSKFIGPGTPYKGLLLFHRIGAGKTCAAVRIAEAWKDRRKVIFVVPASLIGNLYKELRSECTGNEYLSSKERSKLDKLDPASKEYITAISKVNAVIDKRYQICSYHKFVANHKKMNFDNSVLIIDEVQNIVSEDGLFYNVFYKVIHNAPSSMRVVLLSATPIFDKPVEIALSLNLLRPKELLPVKGMFNDMFIEKHKDEYRMKNTDVFRELTSGLISFYRGAPDSTFPAKDVKVVRCVMSRFQWQCYQAVETQEASKIFKDILKLPNNFMIGPRILSNIAFPNRQTSSQGLQSFHGSALDTDNLHRYSIKFCKILGKVRKAHGVCFVYSNFKEHGGIGSLIKVLEHHGYKNLLKEGPGRNRYALWSGDETQEQKEMIRSVVNSCANKDGTQCKVVLGTPAIREGVSLLRVKQVHIMEPYWNISRLEQVIGRAVRFCSHKDVPKAERRVKVYIYIAVPPKNTDYITVDEHIYNMAERKEELIQQFYDAMKQNAVDYGLFN